MKRKSGKEEITFLLFKKLSQATTDKEKDALIKELAYRLSYIPLNLTKSFKWAENHRDLQQIGYLTLLKAIRSFDYNKCDSFYLWSHRWIRKELARAQAKEANWRNIGVESVDYKDVENELVDDSNIESKLINEEYGSLLKVAISRLDRKSREIVEYLYGLNGNELLSIREVAEKVKLSPKTVKRLGEMAVATITARVETYNNKTP